VLPRQTGSKMAYIDKDWCDSGQFDLPLLYRERWLVSEKTQGKKDKPAVRLGRFSRMLHSNDKEIADISRIKER